MATRMRTKFLVRAKWFCSFAIATAMATSMPVVLLGVEAVATHKQVRSIAPRWKSSPVHLNTFCVGPDKMLHLCCGPIPSASGTNAGAIMVYTGEGDLVREVPLDFVPQAINFASDGKCFVAGSGKLARLSSEGVVEIVKDAPNIGNREEMVEELKKAAEEQKKTITDSYSQQLEQIESQIKRVKKEIEKADPDDDKGAKKRERRLKMLEQQQEQWQTMIKQFDESFAVQSEEMVLSQMMRATGIAVSNQDVFVSLPKAAGYGYSIHRLDHDLENATVVVKNVGGCCGQLDIQSDGENLLIAENTAFKVGIYDRDGKRLDSWGQRGRDKADGFGSCCNPMNVRYCENGEILTAESSIGDIKRFSKDGEFLGLIGRASVGGGCKHVAIGWDTSRDWHYMMNQDKSSVAVLVPKDQAPAETEEEKVSRMAMEGLGRKLIGTWEILENTSKGNDRSEFDSYINQSHGHLEFAIDGSLIARPMVKAKPAAKKQESSEDKDGKEENEGGTGILSTILKVVTPSDSVESDDAALAAAMAQAAAQRKSSWKALGQRDDQLDFVMIEEDVQSYGGTVKWVNDEEIDVLWFYGSPENKMQNQPVRFKRISTNACGKTCDGQACETEKPAATESKLPD
ncbi:MAG: hypothetical protein KGQ51_09915 [Planctomycetes bacterium]|nr:hypothetical protein [Planctomycetota bacterium]